jgi:hypothetical protein
MANWLAWLSKKICLTVRRIYGLWEDGPTNGEWGKNKR